MLPFKIFSVKLFVFIMLISTLLEINAKSSEVDSSEGLSEPSRLQKYWADLKHKSKTRLSKRRRDASGTGGGPSSQDDLSEVDKKVLAIIGEQAVYGDSVHRVPVFMTDGGAGGSGAAYLFAEELKMTLERYLFAMCPLTYKMVGPKSKNATTLTCDLDPEHQELAGRLATLALRAHSASRTDCSRFGAALANTLGELARTAANRAALTASNNEVNKKRKLSKSQKAKIQAKQRTALAVKKKAAAVAAAAAAKMAS